MSKSNFILYFDTFCTHFLILFMFLFIFCIFEHTIKGDIVKKNRKKNNLIFVFFFSFLLFVYFAFYYVYVNYITPEIESQYETAQIKSTDYSNSVENAISESSSISDMIEHVSKSVVGISKFQNNSNSIFSNNFNTEVGTGTGIIISSNGYILSNTHVTGEKYSSCYVTLESGNAYEAKVVWSDVDLDLSISKINAYGLTAATLGDSDSIKSGNSVFAIGNPIGFEFQRTVTSGIVSAVNRTIKLEEENSVSYMTDLIQTDATINPGNSGGPLLLPNGEIIGINTVKITSAEGIGFAVPINVVKPVIEAFTKVGAFEEAYIGISAYDSNVIPYLSGSSSNFTSGIYVVEIASNSPAASSQLQEGDIINSIDGLNLSTMNDLKEYIYTKKPNEAVTLNVSRGKVSKEISIILGKK